MDNLDMFIWDGVYGRIQSHGVKFAASEKPELPELGEYLYLFYEPATNNMFKVIQHDGVQINIPLKPEEIKVIQDYCDRFIEEQDYPVWPYDQNRLYVHEMQKSEAIKDKLDYTLIGAPDHPASKFIPAMEDTPEHWEHIKAVIRTDGSLALDPPSLCQLCLLGYTESEWEQMPHPSTPYDRWNFKTETWEDPRSLEYVKTATRRSVESSYDTLVWKAVGDYTPQYQMDTWVWQVEEAKRILATDHVLVNANDQLAAEFPYLYTFWATRTDDSKPKTLKELAQDVLDNHKKYLIASAKVHATLWQYRDKIKNATSNEELDKIEKEVNDIVSKTFMNADGSQGPKEA